MSDDPFEASDSDADRDPFRPPAISTLVGCLHCGEEYDSYQIEWRIETCHDGKKRGFWCCPMEGCDGRGFLFDIFPVDPDYRDEDGNPVFTQDDEDGDDQDDDADDYDEVGGTEHDELDADSEFDGNEGNDGKDGKGGNGRRRDEPPDEDTIPW